MTRVHGDRSESRQMQSELHIEKRGEREFSRVRVQIYLGRIRFRFVRNVFLRFASPLEGTINAFYMKLVIALEQESGKAFRTFTIGVLGKHRRAV